MADLDAAIRAKLNGDEHLLIAKDWVPQAYAALLAILDLHKPFLAELTSDGEIVGYQCMGCGPVEDYGSVSYPCDTVKAIANGFGIEARHG